MKFIQITAAERIIYALGEDGIVYRLRLHDEKIPGKTEYDEFGGVGPSYKTIYSWIKLDAPVTELS